MNLSTDMHNILEYLKKTKIFNLLNTFNFNKLCLSTKLPCHWQSLR